YCGLVEHSRTPYCAVVSLPANLARVAGARIPDILVPQAPKELVYLANRIDVWWYALQTLGVPHWAGWLIAAALILAMGLLARRIGRELGETAPGASPTAQAGATP